MPTFRPNPSLACCLFLTTFAALGATACASSDEPDDEVQSEAFTGIPSSSDFPTDEGWARAMITRACNLSSSSLDGTTGSIRRVPDGVIYEAKRGGALVASAWAQNTFIFAAKRCL